MNSNEFRQLEESLREKLAAPPSRTVFFKLQKKAAWKKSWWHSFSFSWQHYALATGLCCGLLFLLFRFDVFSEITENRFKPAINQQQIAADSNNFSDDDIGQFGLVGTIAWEKQPLFASSVSRFDETVVTPLNVGL